MLPWQLVHTKFELLLAMSAARKPKYLSQGAEVIAADLNDEQSLIKAFQGSTAIYAVTDFFEPFAARGPDAAVEVEVAQGKNLANAAVKTATLKHYIWSTLPNAKKISDGKFLVPHFEAKNRIDDYIKNHPILLPKTTFLWITWYASNYVFPMFTPNFLKTSGKYVQFQLVPPTVPILSIGDTRSNVGKFALAILSQDQLTLGGKFVLAYVEKTTTGELLEAWSKATGKPSVYVQVTSIGDFNNMWPMWGQEMGVMMQFWNEAGDRSWSGEDVLTKEDLGIKEEFVKVEDAYKRMNWSAL